MKQRKMVKLISFFVVMVMAMMSFGGVLAYAGFYQTFDDTRSYDIYRVDASKMTLDATIGTKEPWEKVEWSEQLRKYCQNETSTDGYTFSTAPGHFKMLWANDATASYLYFFIELDDPDGEYTQVGGTDNWQCDVFQVLVDETGNTKSAPSSGVGGNGKAARRTGSLFLKAATQPVSVGNWFEYVVARNGNKVTVEARYTFSDQQYAKANGTIGVEIIAQRTNGSAWLDQYTWSNDSQADCSKAGRGVIKGGYANDLGNSADANADATFYNGGTLIESDNKDSSGNVKLPETASGMNVCGWKNATDSKIYAPGSTFNVGTGAVRFDAVIVNVNLMDGARVKLSESPALKFTGKVLDFAVVGNDLTKVGIVIVETNALTETILEKAITPSALNAAGIKFINCEVDATENFDAVIDTISDTSVAYSAIAYGTVTLFDGSISEFGGEYNAEKHSRSISDVSKAAFADRVMIKNEVNQFKIGKDLGVAGFELFSYSPYTNVQLSHIKAYIKE